MSLIRSVSGVRGIVGEDITPDVARRYGLAFALMARGDIVVGWDSRRNGDELKDAVVSGLRANGARVLDAGIVPTPTVGIAVRRRGLAGGVAITASHNPEEYNGLKFFSPEGIFLDGDGVASLFELVDGELPPPEGDGPEPVGLPDAVDDHLALVKESDVIDLDAVARARPRIAVDCVNAAGSVVLPRLLREIGCDVVEVSTDPMSGFSRGAEPIPAHLDQLSQAVTSSGAVAGLACDPDADRLAIVDETGRAVGEEYTLAAAARIVLSKRKGPLVANVSTSRMIDDLGDEYGVPVYRTRVGEINVVAKMVEVSAVLGGEGNGGVILPEVHLGRDAATAAALIASAVATAGEGIGSLLSTFRPYSMVKRKLALEETSREAIVEAIREAFPDGDLDLTDGAKMSWPDRWVHVRMSGTEPVIRAIAESESSDDAADLVARAASAVTRAAGGA